MLKKGGRFLCLEFSHVSLPLAREAYDLYSFEVIPRMGQAVTGDADSYRYLVESIRQFPKQVFVGGWVGAVWCVGDREALLFAWLVHVHGCFRSCICCLMC